MVTESETTQETTQGQLVGLLPARLRKGWTKAELSRRTDIDQNYLGLLERKKRICSVEVLYTLSTALDSSPNELLGFEGVKS